MTVLIVLDGDRHIYGVFDASKVSEGELRKEYSSELYEIVEATVLEKIL